MCFFFLGKSTAPKPYSLEMTPTIFFILFFCYRAGLRPKIFQPACNANQPNLFIIHFNIVMMMIAPNSRARKAGWEREEVKWEYGGI